MAEFVAEAKRKPGTYNYGSSGNCGTMHMPMEMLKASANFRMTHIPYTGAGPAVLALLAGQVDAVATEPSTAPAARWSIWTRPTSKPTGTRTRRSWSRPYAFPID